VTFNWLTYALLTVFGYVGLDFFVKRASGKIDDVMGAVIINFVSLLPPLLIYFYFKVSGKDMLVTRDGLVFSALAGVAIGLGTIAFIKMFATGTNLSLGSSVVRVGTIIGTVLIGVIFLKEGLSPRQVIGLAMSAVGLGLVLV